MGIFSTFKSRYLEWPWNGTLLSVHFQHRIRVCENYLVEVGTCTCPLECKSVHFQHRIRVSENYLVKVGTCPLEWHTFKCALSTWN